MVFPAWLVQFVLEIFNDSVKACFKLRIALDVDFCCVDTILILQFRDENTVNNFSVDPIAASVYITLSFQSLHVSIVA